MLIEADHQIVLPVEEAGVPAALVALVIRDFPPPISLREKEGVSQTHLTIKLPGIEPSRDPKDGKGKFKLRTIHFDDWRGMRLREEFPREGEVTFGLNHDNVVFVYQEDWRYMVPSSEEIEQRLLAVIALLGDGVKVAETAEVWPLLSDGQGSYVDGDLVVFVGSDARLVQDVYQRMVAEGWEETEDTWKMAVESVRDEIFQ